LEEWQIPANDDKRQGGHLAELAGNIPFLVLPLASTDGAFVNNDDWSYGMYLCVDGTAHLEPL
jgi:hypothetical protein